MFTDCLDPSKSIQIHPNPSKSNPLLLLKLLTRFSWNLTLFQSSCFWHIVEGGEGGGGGQTQVGYLMG